MAGAFDVVNLKLACDYAAQVADYNAATGSVSSSCQSVSSNYIKDFSVDQTYPGLGIQRAACHALADGLAALNLLPVGGDNLMSSDTLNMLANSVVAGGWGRGRTSLLGPASV